MYILYKKHLIIKINEIIICKIIMFKSIINIFKMKIKFKRYNCRYQKIFRKKIL